MKKVVVFSSVILFVVFLFALMMPSTLILNAQEGYQYIYIPINDIENNDSAMPSDIELVPQSGYSFYLPQGTYIPFDEQNIIQIADDKYYLIEQYNDTLTESFYLEYNAIKDLLVTKDSPIENYIHKIELHNESIQAIFLGYGKVDNKPSTSKYIALNENTGIVEEYDASDFNVTITYNEYTAQERNAILLEIEKNKPGYIQAPTSKALRIVFIVLPVVAALLLMLALFIPFAKADRKKAAQVIENPEQIENK